MGKTTWIKAKCPICGEWHLCSLQENNKQYQFTGTGTPRLNCNKCKGNSLRQSGITARKKRSDRRVPTRIQRGQSTENWASYQRELNVIERKGRKMKDVLFLHLLRNNKIAWTEEDLIQVKALQVYGFTEYIHEPGFYGQWKLTKAGLDYLVKEGK